MRVSRVLIAAALAAPLWAGAASRDPSASPGITRPNLILLTLDTTRADHLGCYGAADADTPTLDALAAGGVRYARALTASPLTLPAHASLLTGLEPPEHGLRDNGTAVLDASVPTLATVLSQRGYATGAFVASRVLDRRFGLGAGFDVYDDVMTAEQIGEYGYPERDATAVTSAALQWLASLAASTPYFLWVHYYDPHAPYDPPAAWRHGSERRDYAGEIAFMDSEIGRLLSALPRREERPLIAVVGDHGEAMGEHGERRHGLFLYRASLEVPLILSGPGIPVGRIVDEVVATRRVTPTLLGLVGAREAAARLAPSLPGLAAPGTDAEPQPVYSETWMPANAYGWSPLKALSVERWRLIVAPRPELYDLRADRDESRNVIEQERGEAARLVRQLGSLEQSFTPLPTAMPPEDPELAADLRSLGYLSGSRGDRATIDPKDGVAMLAELDRAKELMRQGKAHRAAEMLRALSRRSPGNIPFLTQLAAAELAAGDAEAALAAHREALSLNPRLDFLHLNLAEAYLELGQMESARREFESALELDRRSARAWLGLGELAHRAGEAERERQLLLDAIAAGTASAVVRTRLGQTEASAGEVDAAAAHYRVATELAPGWALAWVLRGENAEARNQPTEALAWYEKASAIEPGNVAHLLRLGKIHFQLGQEALGRAQLERAVSLAPESPEAREARRLLADR
ncbi:MAG: sulfatase-like hydrolase/transferase [Acidobacteriota bacterium]|nr:sulfatase-like hydrolase/transferase [Acidobacteriota bacterium]